jgi:uncharacterized protein (DUF1697 family)
MTLIALLRAVNLAGRNRVPMADLRRILEDLGLARVRTLLQSGNAVFDARGPGGARLERAIHDAVLQYLGVAVDVILRGPAELEEVIARNPFPVEAARDPARLLVYFLASAPPAGAEAALQAAITGREVARTSGRHAYIVYPDGAGRSRLTPTLVEKRLETRGTARNWNTVLKLAALART